MAVAVAVVVVGLLLAVHLLALPPLAMAVRRSPREVASL